MTEDEMLGDGSPSILVDEHVFEENPGVGDGQGSLVCCSLWGCKESDTNE